MRLSPFDPLGWSSINGMSVASLVAGRFEAAIDWADRALRGYPSYSPPLRYKAAAYVPLGRIKEARACVRAMLAAQPGFTISGWAASYAATAFSGRVLSLFSHGLREAGAPK